MPNLLEYLRGCLCGMKLRLHMRSWHHWEVKIERRGALTACPRQASSEWPHLHLQWPYQHAPAADSIWSDCCTTKHIMSTPHCHASIHLNACFQSQSILQRECTSRSLTPSARHGGSGKGRLRCSILYLYCAKCIITQIVDQGASMPA